MAYHQRDYREEIILCISLVFHLVILGLRKLQLHQRAKSEEYYRKELLIQ
jgi:hypothetical protein